MLMDRVTCAGAASSQLRASGSTHQHTFAGGGHNKHGERLFILSLTVIPVMPDGIVQGQFFFFLLFVHFIKYKTNKTTYHDTSIELYRKVNTDCKWKYRNSYDFYCDCKEYTNEYKSPWKISIHNAFDDHFH